jgi:hypothetical protein
MIFFLGSSKKRKLKKLKLKRQQEYNRRVHMIIEAQKAHQKNKDKAYKAKGGYGFVASMEEEDLGFAVGQGVAKTIQRAGNAIERIKKRQKSLDKSRSKHLDKLKKARATMKKRQR